ncbi:hypothetical protein PFISCL1PPCAC_2726, partial [Pristionchus fissidentatus]
ESLPFLLILPSPFPPTMFSLLGRSSGLLVNLPRLSSSLLRPALYRTPSPIYSIPSHRASSTTSDGGSDYEDFGPIPPIVLYTDGIRGSEEEGSHMGIGIFVDDDHAMNLCLPVVRRNDTSAFNEKTPELQVRYGSYQVSFISSQQAIRLALWRLYKWPSFLMEGVIIRTRFDPVIEEFEVLR